MIKQITKIIGIVFAFLITQIVCTLGVFIFKLFSDSQWYDNLYVCIETGNLLSYSYLSMLSELIMPALFVSDIIILEFVVLKEYKVNKSIIFISKLSLKDVKTFILTDIIMNFLASVVIDSLPNNLVSNSYNSLMNVAVTGNWLQVLLITGVITPVVEELIFRYGITKIIKQNKFFKKPDVSSIYISAFVFGLVHFNIIQSTYAFIFGIILAYVYIKTDNLLPSILIHIGVNASSVLYSFMPVMLQNICLIVMSIIFFIIVIRNILVIRNNNLNSNVNNFLSYLLYQTK